MVLLFWATLSAANAAVEVLRLSDAIQRARENSPDLQQLEAQYQSAVQKSWAAIAPAEPSLSVSDNDLVRSLHPETKASEQWQLTQPIGFPGRAFLNRAQLNDQAEALQHQKHALALQVAVNVKTAYYALQLAVKNLNLNQDTRLSFERVLEVAKRRYETGATAQVDFLNAQVALLSNENDLADLETAEHAARAQLNVLLKQPLTSEFKVDPVQMKHFPKVDLGEATRAMVEHRFEIKAALATERAATKAYRLAWYSLLPDFQLTLGTTHYVEPAGSPYSGSARWAQSPGPLSNPPSPASYPTRTYQIGLQFTIPLWFMFNERAAIAGAAADRAAAARGVDIQLNQSKIALEGVVSQLGALEAKIDRFEGRMLPLADQSFRLALTDYSSGRINFQTLADTTASRRQTRLAFAAAVVSYLTNRATYEQLTGDDRND